MNYLSTVNAAHRSKLSPLLKKRDAQGLGVPVGQSFAKRLHVPSAEQVTSSVTAQLGDKIMVRSVTNDDTRTSVIHNVHSITYESDRASDGSVTNTAKIEYVSKGVAPLGPSSSTQGLGAGPAAQGFVPQELVGA